VRDVKGILALDIDGTVVDKTHTIPRENSELLSRLVEEGWAIIFITGRSFSFSYRALKGLPFSYHLSVFNGALLLEMPSRKVIRIHLLPSPKVPLIVEACQKLGLDPLFHEANAQHDLCYWRPEKHDAQMRRDLERRQALTAEEWVSVNSFEEIGRKKLAYAKIFGPREVLVKLEFEGLATVTIGDPLRENGALMMVTDSHATKGRSLSDFREIVGETKAIAVGDDYNDLSMIEEADIGILMKSAPEEIKKFADLIAENLIEGLKAWKIT